MNVFPLIPQVDEEDAELDKQYQAEKAEEFKQDMDQNGDNIVTHDEMVAYLHPLHKQHAAKEAAYLIRYILDVNC